MNTMLCFSLRNLEPTVYLQLVTLSEWVPVKNSLEDINNSWDENDSGSDLPLRDCQMLVRICMFNLVTSVEGS